MTYSNSSKRERDDLLQFQQLKLIDERRFEKGFEKEERKRRGGERERERAMSKLSADSLRETIAAVLEGSKDKPRKFTETIELQISVRKKCGRRI